MAASKARFARNRISHMCSYLVLSLVPVLICTLLLGAKGISELKAQKDSSVVYGFRQFSEMYHNTMEAMEACSGHLMDRVEAGISRIEIPAQLASYEKNYPQFTSVFYFEKASNRIFTSAGEMDYHDFEKTMYSNYDVDLTQMAFYSRLCLSMVDEAMTSDTDGSYADEDNRYLFYLKVLPKLDSTPKCVAVFMLPIQNLIEHLDDYMPNGYSAYAYSDRFLAYLVQEGNDYPVQLMGSLEKLQSDNPTHIQVGGIGYLLLRIVSNADGTVHMIAYRDDVLYTSVRQAVLKVVFPILGIVLASAIAALMMHRHFYSGIDAMISLPFPDSDNYNDFKTPYEYITVSTKNMLVQNQRMMTDIRNYNVQAIVKEMLYKRDDSNDRISDSERMIRTDLFPLPEFTVAYVVDTHMHDRLYNCCIFAPAIDSNGMLWLIEGANNADAVVLINHMRCAPETIASNVLHFLESSGISYKTIGLGRPQTGFSGIQVSLIQAHIAAMNKVEGLNVFSAFEEQLDIENLIPINEKNELCRSILSGNAAGALDAYEQMTDKIEMLSFDNSISYEWYLFILDTIRISLRGRHQYSMLENLDIDRMISMYSKNCNNKFKELIVSLADNVRTEQEKQRSVQKSSIVQYVAEHILEPDLSIASVSTALGISDSQVISALQENTGMTFAKYTSMLKMEYVCAELRQSNRPIKDIIANAGYQDISNFTRKFRLQYGVTPSAYRASMQSTSSPER